MIAFDTLDDVVRDIWTRLTRGGADRKSPFHTPVVASLDAQGAPQQRVMVLRKCDQSAATLRFHTDVRSDKVRDLAGAAAVSVLGYDPAAKIQIRASGTTTIQRDGEIADAAWAASNANSRRCYLAQPGPGSVSEVPTSGLPPSLESRVPELAETLAGRENFAVLMVAVDTIEWLYLAHDGHRRARFVRQGSTWSGTWLIP